MLNDWGIGGRLTARSAEHFLLQCIHTAFGNHSVSYSVATGSSFPKITMCRYIHYQSIMIDSHIVFPAFCCSALSIANDRASRCVAEKNETFVSRSTSSNGNLFLFPTFPSHTVFLDCKSEASGTAPTSKFCSTFTLILFKIIYLYIRLTGMEWNATLIKSESLKVAGKKYHPFALAKTPSNKTRWK